MSDSSNEESAISVVCIVLLDAENFLFTTRRGPQQSLGGKWEFPGGKVEDGEDPRSALGRELREELRLDLDCNQMAAMSPVEHPLADGFIILSPFRSQCRVRPKIELIEHQDSKWCSLDEAFELDWAPADVPILHELARTL